MTCHDEEGVDERRGCAALDRVRKEAQEPSDAALHLVRLSGVRRCCDERDA